MSNLIRIQSVSETETEFSYGGIVRFRFNHVTRQMSLSIIGSDWGHCYFTTGSGKLKANRDALKRSTPYYRKHMRGVSWLRTSERYVDGGQNWECGEVVGICFHTPTQCMAYVGTHEFRIPLQIVKDLNKTGQRIMYPTG